MVAQRSHPAMQGRSGYAGMPTKGNASSSRAGRRLPLPLGYYYRGLHYFHSQWLPLGRLQGTGVGRLGDAAMHALLPPLSLGTAST